MQIRLTRLDNDTHRLEVVRDGVVVERVALETRSYLLHDLAHFAVEAEAGLTDGFWGHVARGASFAALAPPVPGKPPPPPASIPLAHDALLRVEKLVAPFQSLWQGRLDRALYQEVTGADDAFVDGALARMRRLMGRWKATPFHAVMELAWPVVAEGAP